MCISTTRRNHSALARGPAVDAAQLLSQINIKAELSTQHLSQLESIEPTPIAEDRVKGKKRYPHIIVQHNYHDHSHDNRADYQEERPARGGVTTPFPIKLHEMLDTMAAEGMEDIVSWQPHGRCFLVHKPKEFVGLLPRYFKLSKLASFQRQLNLYGFQRLTKGRDRGGYYHELFLKNRVFLSHTIQRIKVKGTGVRARSNPDQEPDFWGMPWINENDQAGYQPFPAAPISLDPKLTMTIPKPLENFAPQPLQPPPFALPYDDVVVAFGNKTFHYLEPFHNNQRSFDENDSICGRVEELQSDEVTAFFKDFEWADDFGNEIEDDRVFGNILEQMIA